MNDDDDDVDMM